jgi:hypothetical protein
MSSRELSAISTQPVGWPQWLDPSASRIKDGRDPLALETITTDRINPVLVPGVLALSTRARYFSFHVFLLDEYARRRLSPDTASLGNFIRRREFEFAAAVLSCKRCASRPVGVQSTEPKFREAKTQLARDYSVDSALGGYGLYYRSPLSDLGLIAQQGSLMLDQPTPIDLIAADRGRALAQSFRKQIERTDYYQKFFVGERPIPLSALKEYGSVGCLCRLDQSPAERTQLRSALFDHHEGLEPSDVEARRRAFALFLRLLDSDPLIEKGEGAFRRGTWKALRALNGWEGSWAVAASQWAALHGKEYLQEALRLLWMGVNELGRARMPIGGFVPHEFMKLIAEELVPPRKYKFGRGTVRYSPSLKMTDLCAQVLDAAHGADLEQILEWADACEAPAFGAICLLICLHDRAQFAASAPAGSGWRQIAGINGDVQPGLLSFLRLFEAQLRPQKTSEVLQWLVTTRVLRPHDRIATAKLPDFTFRFRLEGGRLYFYSNAGLPFPLADSRYNSLGSLGSDLGLCDLDNKRPQPTSDGRHLADEVFAS